LYSSYTFLPPDQVSLPELPTTLFTELGPLQDAWLCCSIATTASTNSSSTYSTTTSSSSSSSSSNTSLACQFISTSRTRMRKHVNQQHSIQLSC
jgi:hypothetical protein